MVGKNNLQLYRQWKGFRVKDMCNKLEIRPNTYTRKEKGIGEFTLGEALKVAEMLDITAEEVHEKLTNWGWSDEKEE